MAKKTIGWQKYEDFLESQFSSPLLSTITNKLMSQYAKLTETKEEAEENELTYEENEVEYEQSDKLVFPMSEKIIEEFSLLSNYECWVAHTNFDITQEIKNKLDKAEGVDLLKICSRYRFFIGIGKMFSFKDVRKNIENDITK